ncbi:MAG: hypothetical protein Tsb005_07100 [Gammaproteobacteria bacterium]
MSTLIPWSHDLAAYKQMFMLTQEEQQQAKMLDCGSGVASVNAELIALGNQHMVSCDALYAQSLAQIAQVIATRKAKLAAALREHQQDVNLDFTNQAALDDFVSQQQQHMERFYQDYQTASARERYIAADLPRLPFDDHQFDLALSSHFLFHKLLPEHDDQFHIDMVLEMCRVAREVRIYPVMDADGNIAQAIGPVMAALQAHDYGVEIKQVEYCLLKDSNAMLRAWSNYCVV